MKNLLRYLIFASLVAVPLFYAYAVFGGLTEVIPTHWNIDGKADGWGSRESIFLGPGIMAVVSLVTYLLLSNLHRFDPKRVGEENVPVFKNFALVNTALLSALSLVIVRMASGRGEDFSILTVISLFFVVFGLFMPHLKQNYFAGFRLPWTLESEANWEATHKIAGKFWVIGGVVQAVASLLLESRSAFIVFGAVTAAVTIIPAIYSYRMFRKQLLSN